MNTLDQLLSPLKVEAQVFHNGQYCGNWAVDTSGSQQMNFHIISHGNCYACIDNERIDLHKGDAIFFPNDAKHTISNSPISDQAINQATPLIMNESMAADATGLVCGNFSNQHPLFSRLLAPLPDYIVIRADQPSPSADIIRMIYTEAHTQNLSESLLLSRLSDCLLYYLLRDHLNTNNGVFAAATHPKLSKALNDIHQQLGEKHTVDSLADAAGMSRSSFANQFKTILGMSPMDYVTQWRMLCAYRWLSDEQISTFEAAIRCGYENESSFSKAFSRVIGFGPGQARANG